MKNHGLKHIRDRDPIRWLYRRAKKAGIDYLLRLKEAKVSEKDPRPPVVDPSDTILRDIENLSEPYRAVAKLLIQGYNRGAIAERLKIPLGTVDIRTGKIREKLKHRRRY